MKKIVDKTIKSLSSNQVNLLLIPGKSYNSSLMEVLSAFLEEYERVVYVTLNRPATKILDELQKRGNGHERICFIDVISKDIKLTSPLENCHYVSTKELTGISITISECLESWHPSLFVFDSFHTMQAFEERDTIARFAHDLIARLDTTNCRCVFPMLLSDEDDPLTKDLEMFVDAVVEMQ